VCAKRTDAHPAASSTREDPDIGLRTSPLHRSSVSFDPTPATPGLRPNAESHGDKSEQGAAGSAPSIAVTRVKSPEADDASVVSWYPTTEPRTSPGGSPPTASSDAACPPRSPRPGTIQYMSAKYDSSPSQHAQHVRSEADYTPPYPLVLRLTTPWAVPPRPAITVRSWTGVDTHPASIHFLLRQTSPRRSARRAAA
jgi:hypothetical protein